MLDLVIRDAQLIDGTGADRQRGSLGIQDGRIVALGDVEEQAARVIDAGGAIVAPGFVDIHTHYDAQVLWDPMLRPSSDHGATTVFAGNCGFSVAPLRPETSDYLMRMLARVEGMPLAALETALSWDWRSTSDYFDRIDGNVALNIGFMVGHSAIRCAAMGEAAHERTATGEEIDAMKALLRDGLAAGGMGFSSSMSPSHNDATGGAVPSRHSTDEELLELAGVCREFPGTSLEFIPYGTTAGIPQEFHDLMVELSRRAGRPLNWNLVQVATGQRSGDQRQAHCQRPGP